MRARLAGLFLFSCVGEVSSPLMPAGEPGGGGPGVVAAAGGGTVAAAGGGSVAAAGGGGGSVAAMGGGSGGGGGTTVACTHGGALATALVTRAIAPPSGAFYSGVHVQQTPTGAALAWSSGGVHILALDASDEPVGGELMIPGDALLGFVATPAAYSLLVPRGDQLVFVQVTPSGAPLGQVVLISGGDHTVIGTEWFGDFAQTGRLVNAGDRFASYSALHRRWPDGIGHQGDTLKMVNADAGMFDNVWDWGCSHSGAQRLFYDGTRVGAVCQADCYPVKAIMFDHNQSMLSDEPAGNCAGTYGGELGGLTGDGTRFFFTYGSNNMRASWDVALVMFDGNGGNVTRSWIATDAADEREPQLAMFDGQLLAGWTRSGMHFVQRFDQATLNAVGSPEAVSVDFSSATDWQSWSNGDVVWAYPSNGQIQLVRMRACQP